MAQMHTCPLGHTWETADEEPAGDCPHCKLTIAFVPSAADTPETGPTVPPDVPLPGADCPAGYDLLGEVGRGGVGVVYRARQRALNREVAIKMLLAGARASSEQMTRFRTEAEALARLQHPGIVQIYEVGESGGLPYFSMEYCPGGSLAERLDGTPWLPRAAAELVESLARAMDTAHNAGIVHRDLKPA